MGFPLDYGWTGSRPKPNCELLELHGTQAYEFCREEIEFSHFTQKERETGKGEEFSNKKAGKISRKKETSRGCPAGITVHKYGKEKDTRNTKVSRSEESRAGPNW